MFESWIAHRHDRARLEANALRRFVRHVLLDGFHKIRHAGLHALASGKRLEQARACVGNRRRRRPRPSPSQRLAEWKARLTVCPHCGGRMVISPLARCRDPPQAAA
jgi:hypothetical protein